MTLFNKPWKLLRLKKFNKSQRLQMRGKVLFSCLHGDFLSRAENVRHAGLTYIQGTASVFNQMLILRRKAHL